MNKLTILLATLLLILSSCSKKQEEKPVPVEPPQVTETKPEPVAPVKKQLTPKTEFYPSGKIRKSFFIDEKGYEHGESTVFSEEGKINYVNTVDSGFITKQKRYKGDVIYSETEFETEGAFRGKTSRKKTYDKDGKTLLKDNFFENNELVQSTDFIKNGDVVMQFFKDGNRYLTKTYNSEGEFIDAFLYPEGQKQIVFKSEEELKKKLESFK